MQSASVMHARSALAITGSSNASMLAARSAHVSTPPSTSVTNDGRRHHPAVHTAVGPRPTELQSPSVMHSTTQIAVGCMHADVDGREVGHVATTGSLVQLPGVQGVEQIPQTQDRPVEQSAWTRQTSENLPAPDVVVVPPADPLAVPAAPAVPVPLGAPAVPAAPVAPADPDLVLNGAPPHANAIAAQATDNQRSIDERIWGISEKATTGSRWPVRIPTLSCWDPARKPR